MRAGSSPVSGTNRNYLVYALFNGCLVGLFRLKETIFLISIAFRIFASTFRGVHFETVSLESPLGLGTLFYKTVQESPSKNKTSSSVRGYTL